MFEHLRDSEEESLKIQAMLHGINLEGAPESKTTNQEPIFKDPSHYDSMSDEDKAKETFKMMGRLKGFMQQASGMGLELPDGS